MSGPIPPTGSNPAETPGQGGATDGAPHAASHRRPRKTEHWVEIAGLVFGALVLAFFMALVGASIFGHPVPCGSRFLVVVVFALGVALAFSFIGGTAAAKGQFPLPGFREHPIAVGATGGLAALLIILLVGNLSYAGGSDCTDVVEGVELRGKVMDQQSQAIVGAQITVEGYSLLATTNVTGDFEGVVGTVKKGDFLRVHVTHSDFIAQTESMKVNDSSIMLGEIRLVRFVKQQ